MRSKVDTQYVAENVVDIFGEDNIAAAFITGGVASGYGSDTCDIDLLICHRDQANPTRRDKFTQFYLDLHKQSGRIPDLMWPGEVMSVEDINVGLAHVAEMQPARILHDLRAFDHICWAGMLVSKKVLLVPETDELTIIEGVAKQVVDRWTTELCDGTELTEGTGLKTDKDKVLGSIISCPGVYEPQSKSS